MPRCHTYIIAGYIVGVVQFKKKNGVGAGGGADMKPQLSQVIEKGTRGPMVLYPLTCLLARYC